MVPSRLVLFSSYKLQTFLLLITLYLNELQKSCLVERERAQGNLAKQKFSKLQIVYVISSFPRVKKF